MQTHLVPVNRWRLRQQGFQLNPEDQRVEREWLREHPSACGVRFEVQLCGEPNQELVHWVPASGGSRHRSDRWRQQAENSESRCREPVRIVALQHEGAGLSETLPAVDVCETDRDDPPGLLSPLVAGRVRRAHGNRACHEVMLSVTEEESTGAIDRREHEVRTGIRSRPVEPGHQRAQRYLADAGTDERFRSTVRHRHDIVAAPGRDRDGRVRCPPMLHCHILCKPTSVEHRP